MAMLVYQRLNVPTLQHLGIQCTNEYIQHLGIGENSPEKHAGNPSFGNHGILFFFWNDPLTAFWTSKRGRIDVLSAGLQRSTRSAKIATAIEGGVWKFHSLLLWKIRKHVSKQPFLSVLFQRSQVLLCYFCIFFVSFSAAWTERSCQSRAQFSKVNIFSGEMVWNSRMLPAFNPPVILQPAAGPRWSTLPRWNRVCERWDAQRWVNWPTPMTPTHRARPCTSVHVCAPWGSTSRSFPMNSFSGWETQKTQKTQKTLRTLRRLCLALMNQVLSKEKEGCVFWFKPERAWVLECASFRSSIIAVLHFNLCSMLETCWKHAGNLVSIT